MKDAIKKFLPQNFNDLLCLFILGFIFVLWILDSKTAITLNPEITGATIGFFSMISIFYFRKKSGGD